MLQEISRRVMPTPGVQSLALAYVVVMGFGIIFALIVILRLDPAAFFSRAISLYEYWIVIAGALGAAAALRFALPWFGTSSLWLTAGGIGLVTFVAPIVAGTLALPIYGTMFGPMTLALILVASPVTALLWIATLLGVDRLVRKWNAERDSIFGSQPAPLFPAWLTGPLARFVPSRPAR